MGEECGCLAGAKPRRCLPHMNFDEIKSLVVYVTTVVVPTMDRIEKRLMDLEMRVSTIQTEKKNRRPFNFLGDETDDETDLVLTTVSQTTTTADG